MLTHFCSQDIDISTYLTKALFSVTISETEEEEEQEEDTEKPPEPEKKPEKLERKISETFFYNYEDLYSQPFVTSDSGIPINLLALKYPPHVVLCRLRTRVVLSKKSQA